MNRLIKYLFLCLISISVSFLFFFTINSPLPTLKNYESLPEDISETEYLISNLELNQKTGLLTFQLEDIPANYPLSLTINDMGSYIPQLHLSINGTEIYSYNENERFYRTHTIEINPNLIQNGTMIIEIDTRGWQNRSSEIISQKNNASLKIILSSTSSAQKIQTHCFALMCFLIGIIGMIVISCIPISINRPQETSFLFLLILALVRIFCMATDISLIPLSMKHYYLFHHAIVVLPAVLNTAVGLWFLCNHTKKINQNFIWATSLFSLFALLLQYSFEYNWYHLFQFFGFLLFISISYRACKFNRRGWLILTSGYMASYGIVCAIYLTNIWNVFPYGISMICLNITNFSYIISMISSMFFVCLRLIDKYNETEKLTAQLLDINHQLDKKVEERTKELNIAHQHQQNLMLNIFHDLRSPVFILKDYAQRLSDKDIETQKIKKTMLLRLNFLQRLINDLFLAQKLECKKISILKDCVELDELLKEIIFDFETTYKRKIKAHLEPITLWADETRLNQVFQNLIHNAIIHADEHSNITVTVKHELNQAMISIKNTGSGMNQDEIEHAFERYYTTTSATNKEGSGLGLYIAKELVELHEGNILIQSDGKSFTEFIVKLNCPNVERN